MMQQYQAVKRDHPQGILFFRMGDFFEMFYEDAERASRLLGLTLTARSKGDGAVPMAGIPVRAAEGYINRLLEQGEKVVLCDQVQDPSEARGIVERAVTRVVTPGTRLEEEGLQAGRHNYLCGIKVHKDRAGLACVDLSTGDFMVEEAPVADLPEAALRADPAECLLPEGALDEGGPYSTLLGLLACPRSTLPDWRFECEQAVRLLCEHFRTASLEGFGVAGMGPALGAAGAVLHYLQETQRGAVAHVTRLRRVSREDHLVLGGTSRTALEITATQREGHRRGSLVWVLDRTRTPMGARLLRDWLLRPLLDVGAIRERQSAVQELVQEETFRGRLRRLLDRVQDVDRLLARVSCGRATARELVGLRASLEVLPEVREELDQAWSRPLARAGAELPDLDDLVNLLRRALVDEPPVTVREGGLIREGFDAELDELRGIGRSGKDWIASYQASEQARTGIPSLKVGYNKVFGYYVEITNTHRDRVPGEYIRKQTLKNAERYITQDLKEYEEKVLGAEERVFRLEYEHFQKLRDEAVGRLADIQTASRLLAEVDALQSLAQAAREHRYTAPEVDESRDVAVTGGRHPVLEATTQGEPFVPNDLHLSEETRELLLITGPNMAGKSTFIRQAALMTIMAQAGSFVPADSARIGVVDRIFTRIGASDELARGQSTFMVEMIETAEILNNATSRSLVILDEVGRGTSTFDGLALAWAITEHLANRVHARTLFATHYHQMADLAESLPNAVNLNVAVREWGDEIVFLHKIVEGAADRSYGIHVARLAGLPPAVLERANQVLRELESDPVHEAVVDNSRPDDGQLPLFPEPDDGLRRELAEADPDTLTPRQALELLYRLKGLT